MKKKHSNPSIALIDRWSERVQRPIARAEIVEITSNLAGFFDTLSSWHEAETFEISDVAA